MIAQINGQLIEKGESTLVIMMGSVGVIVNSPKKTCATIEPGQHTRLFTHLAVREDNISLYGFETPKERDLFQHLITVSGIGPRLGLAIISSLTVEEIYRAVVNQQTQIFNHVPGIGGKTAQKIILYLHDKFKADVQEETYETIRDSNSELMEALVGLGYSVVEAQAALQSIPKDAPDDLEEKLRIALQYFSQ